MLELLNELEYFLKEERNEIILQIIERKDDYLTLKDNEKDRVTKIHNSIITANEWIIENETLTIQKDIYKHWFHPKGKEIVLQNMKEREKLLFENLALLLQNKAEVLENMRYRNILGLNSFYGLSIGSDKYQVITIGELLQIWTNEPEFSSHCVCGGKGFVYLFGGLMSGYRDKKLICANCGNKYKITKEINYNALVGIRKKYKCTEYIIYNINVLKQMINKFKGINERGHNCT